MKMDWRTVEDCSIALRLYLLSFVGNGMDISWSLNGLCAKWLER